MWVADYNDSFSNLSGFLNPEKDYTIGFSNDSAKDSNGETKPYIDYSVVYADEFILSVKRN